jgi:hypothetical protein
MTNKVLICGTRITAFKIDLFKNIYRDMVYKELDAKNQYLEIIEGCCPDSADEYAEMFGEIHNVKVYHYPSNSGNYLKRNVEMVKVCDEVIAFWDGFSYGTAQTIAQAIMNNKPVKIINLKKEVKTGNGAVAVETTDGIPPTDKSVGILPTIL